jgi:hypothetical protein
MMADASRRQFDVVLFWALDRFTRDCALHTLQQVGSAQQLGVGGIFLPSSGLDLVDE